MGLTTLVIARLNSSDDVVNLIDCGLMDDDMVEVVAILNRREKAYALNLHRNNLTDASLAELIKLTHVASINLADNNIEGNNQAFKQLIYKSHIKHLDFIGNKLSAAAYEALASYTGQETLNFNEASAGSELTKRIQKKLQENNNPTSSNFPSYKGHVQSVVRTNQPLGGDRFFRSFNEIILDLLETFAETESDVKNQLLNVLLKGELTCGVVAKYAADLDPLLGEKFSILYCCYNGSRWNDLYMKECKNVIFEDYDNPSDQSKRTVIEYVKQFVIEFLKKNNMNQISMSVAETQAQSEKIGIISRSLREKETSFDTDALTELRQLKEDLGKIYLEEGSSAELQTRLSRNVPESQNKKISQYSEEWKQLYQIIGVSGVNKLPRDENKMFKIYSAIQYKLQHSCRWSELPREFPPSTTVKHYYREWSKQHVFDSKEKFSAHKK